MSEIDYQSAQEYLTSLVPPREPEMQNMEEYAQKNDFPIIGPVCGYYCYQLARMINAKSVFELGSGYGYSTAWFAKAVKEMGAGSCIIPSGMKTCRGARPAICQRWGTAISSNFMSPKQ